MFGGPGLKRHRLAANAQRGPVLGRFRHAHGDDYAILPPCHDGVGVGKVTAIGTSVSSLFHSRDLFLRGWSW